MTSTIKLFVPFACVAMVLLVVVSGCSKQADVEVTPSNAPASYMNDPSFKKMLDETSGERMAILKERKPLEARMKELVKENGDDLSKLQKIPEWNDLHKKIVALNERYEAARKRQLEQVGARLRSTQSAEAKKEISK